MSFTGSILAAYASSDALGKSIFWALFILSAISWTFFLQRIWLTQKIKKENRKLTLFFQKETPSLLSLSVPEKTCSPFKEIYVALQQKTQEVLQKNRYFSEDKRSVFLSSSDIDLIEYHLQSLLTHKNRFLEKHLFILPTIITLAPFLGLLGTVWGMLLTFSQLTKYSLTNMNTEMLSGLSMALATTVAGLVVVIPVLIAYNYLKSEIHELKKDMNHFAQNLVIQLELQYRKVENP